MGWKCAKGITESRRTLYHYLLGGSLDTTTRYQTSLQPGEHEHEQRLWGCVSVSNTDTFVTLSTSKH